MPKFEIKGQLQFRHREACRMRLNGAKNEEIGKKLGVSKLRVAAWFTDKKVKDYFANLETHAEVAAIRRPNTGTTGVQAVKDELASHGEILAHRLGEMLSDDNWKAMSQKQQLDTIKEMFKAMGVGEGGQTQILIQVTQDKIRNAEAVLAEVDPQDFIDVKCIKGLV